MSALGDDRGEGQGRAVTSEAVDRKGHPEGQKGRRWLITAIT